MDGYLILFTLGPVQEFIAAARRTRDLWAGSQLLSNLSREAARALQTHGAHLIFPAQEDLTKHEVVNRILAKLPQGDPAVVCEAVEQEVRNKLMAWCATAFDNQERIKWPRELEKNFRVNAEAQVADMLEIFWAAVAHTDDYQKDRQDLEAILSARKNTRDFVQPTKWAAQVPKSSIDGLRESVIPEDAYPDHRDSQQEREQKVAALFTSYGAGPAERLSGVDLFKRHYCADAQAADFPSTSHFAALPYLHRIAERAGEEKVKAAFLEYLKELEALIDRQRRQRLAKIAGSYHSAVPYLNGYDASILFESRLAEEIDIQDRDTLGEARRLLNKFFADFKPMSDGRPEPYYALLHGDGDFMGKTINALAKEGIERHRKFSQALDSFASGVREVVEKNRGGPIYSGGDDVLAFLPLDTMLDCAKQLRDAFDAALRAFADKQGRAPTLSIGVAICHYMEPLSDALNLARTAEQIAKKLPNKNGLAITLSKRGSGDRTINGSWSGEFHKRLIELTEWHRVGAIPDSAAYDLHNLIERLGNTLPPAALRTEAIRIVKRKRGQRGSAQEANNSLVNLAETLPDSNVAAQEWGVAQFANELIITREFAKAQGYKSEQEKGVTP